MTDRPDATDNPDTTAPYTSPVRRSIAIGLIVAIVVGLIAVVYVYVTRTDDPTRSAADRVGALLSGDSDLVAERQEVLDLGQQFMLRVNTYGPGDLDQSGQMPAFRERVGELITPKFRASFLQGVAAAEQSVAQAGVGRSSRIFGAGVSSIDADSARVLVAGAFTASYPDVDGAGGERLEIEPTPFRVQVMLIKTEGEWLVDDFVPITAEEDQEPGAPTNPAPTEPAPTDPPGPEPSSSAEPRPEPSPTEPNGNGPRQNRTRGGGQ